MADVVVDFTADTTGDIRELIIGKVVGDHNNVVELVTEYKEQGDVDELVDTILKTTEPAKPTPEIPRDEYTIAHKKFLIDRAKETAAKFAAEIKEMAEEQAKANISSDYDVDAGRVAIKEARADWGKSYSAALETLKMVGSLENETTVDDDGKTSTELVATDAYGAMLLKVSSTPSIRAKRGSGDSATANSDGAKIRAWGKENGFPDVNDRGPMPTALKEAYAAANGE